MIIKKLIKSKVLIFSIILILIGFVFMLSISSPEFKKVNSFEIKSFDDGVFKASMNIRFYNGNWFSMDGRAIEFKMRYNKSIIAIGTSLESIDFHRKSNLDLPVELNFFPDSLKNDLKEIFYKDSILIEIDFSGKFTFLGITSSKIIKTWIKTHDLLNTIVSKSMDGEGLKLKSISFVESNFQQSKFKVDFDFKNTLNLPLELKNMNYSIYADSAKQKEVADWDFKINKEIAANTVEPIQGEVLIGNLSSVLTGISKAFDGKFDYYLVGHALIAFKGREIKIPIKKHFLVEPLTQNITFLNDYE